MLCYTKFTLLKQSKTLLKLCLKQNSWGSCVSLPMQETQVRSPVQKDPTRCRALSPCSTSTEPALGSLGASAAQLRCLEPARHSKRSHCKKPVHHSEQQPRICHNQRKARAAGKTQHSQK